MSRSPILAALLLASFALHLPAAPPAEAQVSELLLQPSSLVLSSPEEGRRVLVTGVTAEGEKVDLSREARLEPADDGVRVDEEGFLYPVTAGVRKVKVSAGGRAAELTVKVGDLGNPRPVNFLRDVMPILNKVGCTAGGRLSRVG